MNTTGVRPVVFAASICCASRSVMVATPRLLDMPMRRLDRALAEILAADLRGPNHVAAEGRHPAQLGA